MLKDIASLPMPGEVDGAAGPGSGRGSKHMFVYICVMCMCYV